MAAPGSARSCATSSASRGGFGWSFGGYISAMAALLRPDVFKAAIAGTPVTDWALYDTAYTERYLKTPKANPDGYAREQVQIDFFRWHLGAP